MTATATRSPVCPTCGGEMWDERKGKYWGNGLTQNGKNKPIYKCKDKSCEGVIWPPKQGGGRETPPENREHWGGGKLPNETEQDASGESYTQTGAPPKGSPDKQNGASPKPKLDDLVHSYGQCLVASVTQYAPYLTEKGITVDVQAIHAMATTLFIERSRRGV